jgi:O-antigen/teichoic acid export membrane protein
MKKGGVAEGVALNVLGQVAVVASGGLVSILLAREYGKEIFGQWSVAIVYGTMVGAIVEGGFARVLLRDASRDRELAGRSLGAVLKSRTLLSAITVPIALAVAWFSGMTQSAWILVLLTVLARALQGLLSSYQNVLTAFEYFRASNLVETARRTAMFLAVVAICALDLPIHWAAAATLVFTLLGTTYLTRLTKTIITVDFSGSPRGYWTDAIWSWINGFLFWVTGDIGLLILSKLAGDAATGVNSAAQKLAMLFLIIPRGVNYSIIPRLFRSTKDGKNLHKHLNATTLLLTAVACVAAVELWMNAEVIIHLAYSSDYADAAPALQVYGLFLMFNFMRTPPSWYLTTSDRLPTITLFLICSGVVIVGGNVLLVPKIGGIATAWVCAAAEVLTLILATSVTVKHTGPKILIAYGLGLIPGAIALGVHVSLPRAWPWYVPSAIVSITFAAAFLWVAKKLMRGWNPLGILTTDSGTRPDLHSP